MLDYIIVGGGLAGICFAETALTNGKSFCMIDSEERSSSLVAGGMYNPVVLKRFTEVWKTREQIDLAKEFYKAIEARLGLCFNHAMPLYRRFASVEEQNNWFQALDKQNLSDYLCSELIYDSFNGVQAPFDYGEVKETGYLNTKVLIESYRSFLASKGLYQKEGFDYSKLKYDEDGVEYGDIRAKHIIFAEGFGLHANPFFNNLPLDGTKGELLLVRIPDLKINFILKAKIFVIPLGSDLFKVGATYDWNDKSDTITESGREELIEGLKEVIDLDFEVVEHLAGVRPTVKDRKPLVGSSKKSKAIHVLNGLGTRGVLLGPFLARALFESIEYGTELDNNISIERFKK